GFPKRYLFCLLGFLGFVNLYTSRVVMSIGIQPMKEEFGYSSFQQGLILSSFFFGYIFTQIPGGWIGSKYSGKWVFGLGIFVPALLTLITPLAAQASVWILILVRTFEGFFQGVV